MRVSVVIPTFNEAGSIARVLDDVPPSLVTEVLVVDAGSTDGTREIAAARGARVIVEPRRGYGRACLTGLAAANDPEVVVFLDGNYTAMMVAGTPSRRQRSACAWIRSRAESPRRPGRRCAFVEGFSLHANTGLHENDVLGLQRLCSYGARGPLSLERLSALPDGRLAYRMKRPSPSGQTHLVLSPLAFLRRLATLVPPPRANLVRYFGVFAPNARLRPSVVPAPPPASALPVTDEPSPLHLSPPARPRRPRRPIPWAELLRRTFGTVSSTVHAAVAPAES